MRRYVWRSNILQSIQFDHIPNENNEPGDHDSDSPPCLMFAKYLTYVYNTCAHLP